MPYEAQLVMSMVDASHPEHGATDHESDMVGMSHCVCVEIQLSQSKSHHHQSCICNVLSRLHLLQHHRKDHREWPDHLFTVNIRTVACGHRLRAPRNNSPRARDGRNDLSASR